jgi:hypothetical protein
MQSASRAEASAQPRENPFQAGAVVVVTLGNPREKFWGVILALAAEGLSFCGIELSSFETRMSMVKEGEPFGPGVIFFPMHRLERIELDLQEGDIPSLSQRFAAKTGRAAAAALMPRSTADFPAIAEQK